MCNDPDANPSEILGQVKKSRVFQSLTLKGSFD